MSWPESPDSREGFRSSALETRISQPQEWTHSISHVLQTHSLSGWATQSPVEPLSSSPSNILHLPFCPNSAPITQTLSATEYKETNTAEPASKHRLESGSGNKFLEKILQVQDGDRSIHSYLKAAPSGHLCCVSAAVPWLFRKSK